MNPTVKVHPGVKKWIADEVRNMVEHLMRVSPLYHKMIIELCPAPAITCENGIGFGAFLFVLQGRYCRIAIACDWLPWRKDGIGNRKDALHFLMNSVAHEWGHYEQFRDGGTVQERGVNRRVKRLTKGYFKDGDA